MICQSTDVQLALPHICPKLSASNFKTDVTNVMTRGSCKWGNSHSQTLLASPLQSELEKLREGLSGDADSTAQALLSDKIQQLQLQIQNMQVGCIVGQN